MLEPDEAEFPASANGWVWLVSPCCVVVPCFPLRLLWDAMGENLRLPPPPVLPPPPATLPSSPLLNRRWSFMPLGAATASS